MSDTREQMLQAAALVISALLTAGGYALFLWIRTPIVDAKRLAEEGEPAQEATFVDPLDANPKTRLYADALSLSLRVTQVDTDSSIERLLLCLLVSGMPLDRSLIMPRVHCRLSCLRTTRPSAFS